MVALEPGNFRTVLSGLVSRLTSLYGFVTRMTSCTPGISSSDPGSTSPWLPVMPMAVRCAPGMEWARYPSASIFWQTARTWSSVACAFMTTSIGKTSEYSV